MIEREGGFRFSILKKVMCLSINICQQRQRMPFGNKLVLSLIVLSAFRPGIPYAFAGDAGVNPPRRDMPDGAVSAPGPLRIKEHIIKTADGWEISISRYIIDTKGAEDPKAAVILCHGFNFNNLFWDLEKKVSLARYLARNGYDVWVPSLRGAGASSKPLISDIRGIVRLDLKNLPREIVQAPSNVTKTNWTIDDHVLNDVPAIVNYVKKKSGFEKVYWIGHSMGGIIMFGYLERIAQDDIAGFIPVGSMVIIPSPLTGHLKRIADQEPLLRASLIINTRLAANLRTYSLGKIKYPIEEILLKRENMDEGVIYRLFRNCISDTSPGVVSQFSTSIRTGSMISSDKTYDYSAGIGRVSVPLLIMAGGADAFVDESILRRCYDLVSSADKSLIVCSKRTGYSADYGHCDLLIGRNSRDEIYPVILEWLDRRSMHKSLIDRLREFFM